MRLSRIDVTYNLRGAQSPHESWPSATAPPDRISSARGISPVITDASPAAVAVNSNRNANVRTSTSHGNAFSLALKPPENQQPKDSKQFLLARTLLLVLAISAL